MPLVVGAGNDSSSFSKTSFSCLTSSGVVASFATSAESPSFKVELSTAFDSSVIIGVGAVPRCLTLGLRVQVLLL